MSSLSVGAKSGREIIIILLLQVIIKPFDKEADDLKWRGLALILAPVSYAQEKFKPGIAENL